MAYISHFDNDYMHITAKAGVYEAFRLYSALRNRSSF